MFFYEIVPADRSYHGGSTLTYSHDDELPIGQIVVVKLRTKAILGFVVRKVEKPTFTTKPIERIIADVPVIPPAHAQLATWLQHFFPAPLGVIGSLFVPSSIGIQKLPDLKSMNTTAKKLPPEPLTKHQQNALTSIASQKHTTYILHGDTGTGKTRLYIELAHQTLARGKSVLVLTPEIGLTPQLIKSFEASFENVHVTHSELTETKRRDLWRMLAATDQPQILIGPRSALFMPLHDIGLIVIDEFHDGAYKQEQAPYYRAIRVAAKLREIHGATLVLGSATPPIDDYYVAASKNVPVIRMTEKPPMASPAKTNHYIVDLASKDELTKHPLISKTLADHLQACLSRSEQALLFLNKRGSARLLVCQACGWFAACDRCDLPYTYHQDTHQLQCHTCGKHVPAPHACESCGSTDIMFKSPGTKAIESSIRALFPEARVARFDRDNTTAESFSTLQPEIADGSVDILIGTQLLSKGHDLPNLSLVGILLADGGLQFPDYGSEERSYQLLHQLAGRVGRGHREGTVVVQTYAPTSPILKAIDHGDNAWHDFYESQIEQRQAYGFPPFYHMLKIEVGRTKSASAQKTIEAISEAIAKQPVGVRLIGPSPSFIAKRGNVYYWQLIAKASHRQKLLDIITKLPARTSYDIDPLTLL